MAKQENLFETPAPHENDKRSREALTQRWFALTRERLPQMARTRGGQEKWPVHLDHCFMRVLLDNACGGKWRDHVKAPAYAHAPLEMLKRAVALGEAVARGEADLWELNRKSLKWRGKG